MWQRKYKTGRAKWEEIGENLVITLLQLRYRNVVDLMADMKSSPRTTTTMSKDSCVRWVENDESEN